MRSFFFVLLMMAECGWGAVLSGRVSDPSGAVVPGASVKVSGQGRTVVTSTDRNGMFRANLEAGKYDVAAEAPGFAEYSRRNLEVGESLELQVVLQISTLSEQVTVTAKAPAAEGALETSPRNSREVLEMREVRESAARDVGEALSSLEGLWMVRKGGIANDVVLRGFQQGNVDVLIDGQRIYGACPGHMDPAAFHVDFAEIESVNVTKGPFDVTNQGSLAGTVNLVSRKQEPGLRITPTFGGGSFGFYNPSLTASYSSGKVFASGGYSYRRSQPYVDGSGRNVTSYANYTAAGRDHPAFEIPTGWGRVGAELSPRQSLDLSYTRQASGLTLYPALQMDAPYDHADRLGANYSAHELTGVVKQVRAQAFFTQVKHWMTDELRSSAAGSSSGYTMGSFAGTRALGGRIEAELPDAVVGAEASSRGWTAVSSMKMMTMGGMGAMTMTQASLPDVRTVAGGLYGQYRRGFGRLHVVAGARVDAANSGVQKSNPDTGLYWAYHSTRSTFASDVDPSGNFWLTYLLPKGVELFGGLGSTVRLPDPEERYYSVRRSGNDWVGNPTLKPTRNNEADLGINWRNRFVSLRPTVFYSRLENFIAIRSQPLVNMVAGLMNTAARSYEGVDARVYGGEFSYSVGLSRSLLVSGGASYTRGIQYAKPSAGMAGGNIAEMPPLKSRTSVRYGARQVFFEVEGEAVAAQNHVDPSLREQRTAGYGLLGLKGGTHGKRINLAAGVDNLLNRFYYSHLSFQRDPFRTGVRIPEPGRTLYVNVSVAVE